MSVEPLWALDSLAERLAPRLARRLESVPHPSDEWLTAKAAAQHLGISVTALHKLASARIIPFEQDGPGCKLWFAEPSLTFGAAPRHSRTLALPKRFQTASRASTKPRQ